MRSVSMKMTRSEKLVFLYLKGWSEYCWQSSSHCHRFLEELRDARYKGNFKILPNIELSDFEIDHKVLSRSELVLNKYWYSVEKAYEFETNDEIG